MDKQTNRTSTISAQPRFHQRAAQIQPYGTASHALPLELEEPVRLEMTERLNQLLADAITLRDLYKKSHWQVAGATFYQLHLLFDKHYEEQAELVDSIAERIQLLGGVTLAMAADVAETTQIERHLAVVRKCLSSCRVCSTLIRSSFVKLEPSRAVRPDWVMTAPMTWS